MRHVKACVALHQLNNLIADHVACIFQCITCSMTIQSKLANHLMLYLSSHDAIMLVEVQCQANGKQ